MRISTPRSTSSWATSQNNRLWQLQCRELRNLVQDLLQDLRLGNDISFAYAERNARAVGCGVNAPNLVVTYKAKGSGLARRGLRRSPDIDEIVVGLIERFVLYSGAWNRKLNR